MQESLFEHFKSEGHSGFLGNVSITPIDKAGITDSKNRKNYRIRALKPYALLGLNIEDCVGPILRKSIHVGGGLTFFVFFGILFRTGTDLGQDFSGMKYVLLHLLYFLFPYC